MKASELVETLNKKIEHEGDFDVVFYNGEDYQIIDVVRTEDNIIAEDRDDDQVFLENAFSLDRDY